jgi:NADPH:quinone reductase-like Zn-dependent oxidoreductase
MTANRVVITRVGGPEVLRAQAFDALPPGSGEITVAVRAAGINFADVFCRLGLYEAAPPVPFAPGFEVAGEVEAVGRGVTRFRPGDRVLAVTRFGGYASRVNVSAALARPLPSSWSFEEGAAFPVVFLTAWYGLVTVGRLAAGETVVVQSAAGGVGTAACQIARALGARVLGTVGSEAKRETARAAGASEVIVSPTYNVWDEVARMSPGVDLVFDAVGGRGLRRGLLALRPGGRLVSYGFASMMPKGGRRNWPLLAWRWLRTPRFSPFELTFTNRTVAGFNLVHLFDRLELFEESFRRLEELQAQGLVRPWVGAVFPFTEAPGAHELLQSRGSTGKLILTFPA